MASISSDAPVNASCRMRIGTVPAWPASPSTTTRMRLWPMMPVTTPSGWFSGLQHRPLLDVHFEKPATFAGSGQQP